MTLLPIADRELRVSARSKATHRLRITFAMGAVAIAGAIGLISLANHNFLARQLGVIIFDTLKWIAFAFACAAGIFLTADCLSEEKREGTLGLLFLTDLRGYDVVLGKLFATSLRSFYSLLAIFPVMAFSFVLGGVAPDDFRHTLVSLCNTLFFSLALGMLISVVSRDANKAMTGTLAALAVFLFLVPGWLSPNYSFHHTAYYKAGDFWLSTMVVHLEGWCFLAIASWLAPRTWHEKGIRPGGLLEWRIPLFNSSSPGSNRRNLLDQNPICWIISRDRWASNLSRLAVIVILGALALSLALYVHDGVSAGTAPLISATSSSSSWTTNSSSGVTVHGASFNYHTSSSVIWTAGTGSTLLFHIAAWCISTLSLVLELWLASYVARFYIDGTKNGFLELLLVTPVRPLDIIRGHWLALRRLFLAPVAALLFLNLVVGTINIFVVRNVALGNASVSGPALAQITRGYWGMIFMVLLGQIGWVIGLFALAWFAIWMGLTSKKLNVAVLKTFCFVKILPWFGVGFAVGLSAFFVMLSFKASGLWIIMALPQALIICVNFALIALARIQVRDSFSSERSAS